MRLWTIAPIYLDSKGLVALWREGLLALNVLQGNTKGYKNHPQLERFKATDNPELSVSQYLHYVCDEADYRGYKFDRNKLLLREEKESWISVNFGQVLYEYEHLNKKLLQRTGKQLDIDLSFAFMANDIVNDMFLVNDNREIESWEKV